ncbi:MAG TPA: SPOR domain-containing protein [Paludibacter sp.]
MEKFCKHIEKLLAQHDYVVVPDLGGFVVQMQSAQLLPDRITPPHATIAFNPLMHHADGLLAIEIARTEKISYRKAVEYIEKEIESTKFKLNSTGSISFGNLGTIRQDETGNLLFAPKPKVDFLPQNFQLSDLFIATKELRKVESKKKITITMPSGNMFKYAAAAMILFGLFAVTPKVSDSRTNSANLVNITFAPKPKVKPQATTIVAADSLKEIKDTIKIALQKSTAPNTEIKTVAETKVSKEVLDFHVIVASSATKESAERYCKELVADNFKEAQVLPPVKTYRVAIQSFSDREEAIRYMENLRQTDSRFETAWVLCN